MQEKADENGINDGEGADLHVEAAGVPEITIPVAEKTLAINGRITVNFENRGKVVIDSRSVILEVVRG